MTIANNFWLNLRHFLVAVFIVAIASLIRLVFFESLGRGIPYLTYYPAVMLAALFGGLSAGLVGTVISALLSFYWIQHGFMSPVETLAISVFLLSCIMISVITETMRRAQTRARQAQEKAETANRAKSVFLANMSHELRTPLNAILGFSKLMREDASVSTEHRQTLEIINRSGEHLLSLINNVLDMAKVESGRVSLEKTVFDLQIMIQSIIALMRQRAEAKGLRLTLEMAPDLPRAVEMDESKLRQVILNLVGNAIKFTSQGEVTLHAAVRPPRGLQEFMLMIEVEDTGQGIDAKDLQRVFEPFVQLGHKSDQKGTGLGLTITRQFVALMGGEIRVESEVNKGTKFFIELPLKSAEAIAAAASKRQDTSIARLAPGQPEYRILIVEDQIENWMLLKQLLERAGFQVNVAENGAEGIEAFHAWRPQLIWMDWRMPVMDGLEATRRIRAQAGGRDVKIVALSASVLKEDREQVLAAGVDDFIFKPIQFPAIYDCLIKQLGVQFVHETVPGLEATGLDGMLEPTALAGLPSALLAELMDSLISLDEMRITRSIRQVVDLNPSLGHKMEDHASRFQYTVILQALQAYSTDILVGESPQ